MRGLDLFSGIGGISLALKDYVEPVAFCEIDKYCQKVLSKNFPNIKIFDDVRTIKGDILGEKIDIIYGGFPCQDISVAGHGKGLDGERSGLFYEIVRLTKEIQPSFVFLENVPAIRRRGLFTIVSEFASMGYDCRWTIVSAKEVGAPHIRKRWFLLAHANRKRLERQRYRKQCEKKKKSKLASSNEDMAKPQGIDDWESYASKSKRQIQQSRIGLSKRDISYPECDKSRLQSGRSSRSKRKEAPDYMDSSRWFSEPNVDRVVDGVPFRVDRVKALGNSVVPLAVKKAFEKLMGLKAQGGADE